jgi:hypothetical protein
MIFITVNGYMEGGAVGMGDQYREQSPCLHLGPILVLVSGVRSIFELCLFFCCGGMGKSGDRRMWPGSRGEGHASSPGTQRQSSPSWCMVCYVIVSLLMFDELVNCIDLEYG